MSKRPIRSRPAQSARRPVLATGHDLRDLFQCLVRVLVEPEDHLRPSDEYRPPDEIWILDHEVDRFLLRFWQRPLLENGTSCADEIHEACRIDMALQEVTRRRLLVDVYFLNVHAGLVQKTSGILARRSGRLCIERGLHTILLRSYYSNVRKDLRF